MEATAQPIAKAVGLDFFAFLILAGTLLFAPLIKGGNRPFPLLVLELAAIALAFFLLFRQSGRMRLARQHFLLALTIPLLHFIQYLPLPAFIWAQLPGHAYYVEAGSLGGTASSHHAISLIPQQTEASLLTLMVPVIVFLATLCTSETQLKRLAQLIIGLAVLQSVIGLAQFGTGSLGIITATKAREISAAFGTYANPDHLAGFLEMALPLTITFLASSLPLSMPSKSSRLRKKKSWRDLIRYKLNSGIHFNALVIYAAATLAILLGMTFTHSRAGLALGTLGVVLCILLFSRWTGAQTPTRIAIATIALGGILAVEIGLSSVISRFNTQTLTTDFRWAIYSETIAGIREFFPLGSGFGTYPEIFRRFQPESVPQFVNHAHNDYLEWLFEGGLLAAAVILAFAISYLRHWRKIWPQHTHCSAYSLLRVSAGISIALMAIHELFDFNLHIPANAITFAFMTGVFFHRNRDKTQKLANLDRPGPSKPPRTKLMAPNPIIVTPGEIKNPFAT